ncbi:MAG: DUF3089 domain-containing protein [Rikenellaceae bacterium]|jgi:hypothetical protein|nr:DUF3089 domain-containing protein [Rikenellaceae bacterium]
MKKSFYLLVAVALLFGACGKSGGEKLPKVVDYAESKYWLHLPTVATEAVDVFYVYPTVISTSVDYCAIDDAEMVTEATKLYVAYNGIFAGTNFYAPYYHQLSIDYIARQGDAADTEKVIREIPMRDCKAAFEYYLANHNAGRPIIFAGHSQGTMILKELLLWIRSEHPEVLDRMVAAYMIGFAINGDYLAKVGLPFATGRTDTGSVICWNTEAPDADTNPFTQRLYPDCLAINPINWATDQTYAPKEESLGTRLRPEDDPAVADHPHFADAVVDLERGTVVTTAPVSSGSYWPKGILHHFDYDLFYYDFKQNVTDRIEAYMNL